MATVGERIKELRLKLGLSQVEFASKIGVSKQTLYKYENNIITNIPSDKIEAIADCFGISPATLMGWDTEQQTESYYTNPETAALAQELLDNPDLRMLFDAARDVKPENLQLAAEMLKRMKETNPDG